MTTSFNYNFFRRFLFAPILLAGAVIRFYTVCAVLMIDSKGGMHQSCGFYLPQVSSVKFLETTKYIIDEKQYLTVLVGGGGGGGGAVTAHHRLLVFLQFACHQRYVCRYVAHTIQTVDR